MAHKLNERQQRPNWLPIALSKFQRHRMSGDLGSVHRIAMSGPVVIRTYNRSVMVSTGVGSIDGSYSVCCSLENHIVIHDV